MIVTAVRPNGDTDHFKVSGGVFRAWKNGLTNAGFSETVYTNGTACMTALGRDEYHYDASEWIVARNLTDGEMYLTVFYDHKPVSVAKIRERDSQTMTLNEAQTELFGDLKKVEDVWGADEGYWPLFHYFSQRRLT